ncbi:MerR family transcriptional regulator [Cytobacillus sp.]|uniref:MerR family transcriptional regulator n=1 Tax=Cytobacillus sp. TaxID=2675269 RepID=UPI0028BEA04A|nr:MerR family transcriptional regulator [Cytobacillus sp.]
MKISELSEYTGVSTRSIRYYEKKNLIKPSRTKNGYRVYDEQDIRRVKAIQFFLDIGLKTDEQVLTKNKGADVFINGTFYQHA